MEIPLPPLAKIKIEREDGTFPKGGTGKLLVCQVEQNGDQGSTYTVKELNSRDAEEGCMTAISPYFNIFVYQDNEKREGGALMVAGNGVISSVLNKTDYTLKVKPLVRGKVRFLNRRTGQPIVGATLQYGVGRPYWLKKVQCLTNQTVKTDQGGEAVLEDLIPETEYCFLLNAREVNQTFVTNDSVPLNDLGFVFLEEDVSTSATQDESRQPPSLRDSLMKDYILAQAKLKSLEAELTAVKDFNPNEQEIPLPLIEEAMRNDPAYFKTESMVRLLEEELKRREKPDGTDRDKKITQMLQERLELVKTELEGLRKALQPAKNDEQEIPADLIEEQLKNDPQYSQTESMVRLLEEELKRREKSDATDRDKKIAQILQERLGDTKTNLEGLRKTLHLAKTKEIHENLKLQVQKDIWSKEAAILAQKIFVEKLKKEIDALPTLPPKKEE